ncbi:MAG: SMP-30/gluconolactonase/LRE family protein [Sphingomonadales bacterium]|nr:SMP-30/gluconolactonase/LRE family protein [Sphingomonadales bacterium]
MRLTRIASVRCTIGEAPVWDDVGQALFLLDIPAQRLIRYDPVTGEVRDWETPGAATALALSEAGEALLAIDSTIHLLNLAIGQTRALAQAPGQATNATLNDGRTDRQGRFVFGSCCTDFDAPSPVGGIYGLDRGRCTRLADDILFSNGTCFSPDGATLYFADGARHAIFAYAYDPATGAIGERRLLADTSALGGMPDGATVDAEGRVWVAINPGGKVAAFRPDGTPDRVIDLPANRPGSVAFGGENLDRLFITTLDPVAFGEAADDHSGYLYIADGLGVRGLPEPRYRH